MFKEYRKTLSLTPEEIIEAVGASGKSAIYYLEKSYLENKLFNYLVLLRSKGVDMNKFVDEIITKDYPQYLELINKISPAESADIKLISKIVKSIKTDTSEASINAQLSNIETMLEQIHHEIMSSAILKTLDKATTPTKKAVIK
jgi:hypothetical protein